MLGRKESSKEEIAERICRLWEPLTDDQRRMLSQSITLAKFKKNQIIYKEFEKPTQMMCLMGGKVKIYKEGVGGHQQIIRAIKPVELFAYRAFIAGEDYKTSAMALEQSLVAMIPVSIVEKLMNESIPFNKFLIRHLSAMLGDSDNRTVNLTQKHIRGRLAEALIFLEDNYGLEEDGYTLSIYLSREDLANLSNMTTSNAIRTLSAFANEKLIAIDGRKIKIIRDQELRKISSIG